MSQPVCAGGLAVGAGDAAQPHRFGGPAVELVREKSCLRPEVLEARVGHLPAAVPGETVALPDDRRAATLDRLRDVTPAIGSLAGPGEERCTGRGPPAVGGQAFDRGPLEQCENAVNQVFSLASSPSPGISMGDSGAS